MSKLERLNARVAKLLTEAVQEVLEVVKDTVTEYQEKTARTQRENEALKRQLLELQDKITMDSTPFLPASVTQDKQDAKILMEELSVPQNHSFNVTLTEHEPMGSLTTDHSVKLEGKGQESFPDAESAPECDFVDTSTDYCRVEPEEEEEEEMHVIEEALAVQTSHRVEMNNSSVSTNNPHSSHSRSPLLLDVSAIKTEAEPTNCTPSQLLPLQEHYPGCVDLSCNSARLNPDDKPQVRAQTYDLVFGHTKHNTARRHMFAKHNRATFDMTRLSREHFRGEEAHLCVVCGKTFSRVANLRIHQRCHTGEKPYGCAQCGRRFSQAGDLKKHKRVHTGEKPYYCNQCGKSFSRGENLKRHQKIHIGETLHSQQVWMEQQL